jgi:transcriptional regulator with XRE-family HTH domain
VSAENLIAEARRTARLSQTELACRAHTSRPTLSAYEHGRKSPTLETAARLLGAAGFDLVLRPRVTFTGVATTRGRTLEVPTALPRLPLAQAFAVVVLPVALNWSAPDRAFDLSDRAERARVYEIVLREGTPEDVLRYIDGTLLVDLWNDLVIPRDVRAAWAPLVADAKGTAA